MRKAIRENVGPRKTLALAWRLGSRAGVEIVDGEFEILPVTVKGRCEKLKETSESEEWAAEGKGVEADPGPPLAPLLTLSQTQGNFGVAEWHGSQADSNRFTCRSVG
jgi:hypothetical protein